MSYTCGNYTTIALLTILRYFYKSQWTWYCCRSSIPSKGMHNPTLQKYMFRFSGLMLWNSVHKQIRSYSVLESFKNQFTRFMLLVPDEPPIRGYKSPNLLSTVVGDYYGQSITALVQTCGRPQKGP